MFDDKIIELNFGCPDKKIFGGLSSSTLMWDRKLASEILYKTLRAVKIPFMFKNNMG